MLGYEGMMYEFAAGDGYGIRSKGGLLLRQLHGNYAGTGKYEDVRRMGFARVMTRNYRIRECMSEIQTLSLSRSRAIRATRTAARAALSTSRALA